MPNASNTDRVVAAIGGEDTTADARRHRRPGSPCPAPGCRRSSPRPPRCPGSVSAASPGRGSPASPPAPATPARTGSRWPCPSTSPPALWEALAGHGRRPGRTRRTRHPAPRGGPAAPRPRARAGDHAAAGRARLGRRAGTRRTSAAGPRWPPSATGASPAGSSAWPPRGASRPARDRPSWATAAAVGTVTSGNFSPMLEHGIALALVDSGVGRRAGRALELEQRGKVRPATVVATPFVRAGQCADPGMTTWPVGGRWSTVLRPTHAEGARWVPTSPTPTRRSRTCSRSSDCRASTSCSPSCPRPSSSTRPRAGRRGGGARRAGPHGGATPTATGPAPTAWCASPGVAPTTTRSHRSPRPWPVAPSSSPPTRPTSPRWPRASCRPSSSSRRWSPGSPACPVSNASLYDGGSAAVEAVNLGVAATGRQTVWVSGHDFLFLYIINNASFEYFFKCPTYNKFNRITMRNYNSISQPFRIKRNLV